MLKLTTTCPCGKAFTHYPSVPRKACSKSHSAHYFPRRPKTGQFVACRQCGTEIWQEPSAPRVFCSRSCLQASQSRRVEKPCAVCGKVMSLKPSHAYLATCSLACRSIRNIKRPLDRMHNGKPAAVNSDGYILLWEPDHPNRSYGGWQPEHRLVVERLLGRYLLPGEEVDHINRDKADNRLENLQVLDSATHLAKTVSDNRNDRVELATYRERFGPLT